ITERREAAEREALHLELVETVIHDLPAAVAIIRGSDLRYRLANPAYLSLVEGTVIGSTVIGSTVDEVWPELRPHFRADCQRVLDTGEPHEESDVRRELIDGATGQPRVRYFSGSLHRVVLPGEDEVGLLATVWETTERKVAERS